MATPVAARDEAKERRLEQLRQEAQAAGLVRAPGIRPTGAPFPVAGQLPWASAESGYYGLPLLKRPTWIWTIPVYFFVGGAAGAGAVVATVARWRGEKSLARAARLLAVGGALLSPPLLIVDLGRPLRFLHMLRVFKWRSPMSVGVWTVMLFSMANTGALALEYVSDRREEYPWLVRWLALLNREPGAVMAALSGLAMCTYTGVLVGVTAIPVWSENVRLLPAHFGASGLASAVAILELSGHTSAFSVSVSGDSTTN
jgi:formate-dependent nitrite reductase membrane component NrfD